MQPFEPETPKTSRYRDDDAVNPYRAPAAPSSGLKPLGSLAQSARLKQLNTARMFLIATGIIFIVLHALAYPLLEKFVDDQIQLEIRQLEPGMEVNQAKLQEIREMMLSFARAATIGMIGLGMLYVIFGLIVKKYPVSVTILSLVIFLGMIAIFGFLDPMSLLRNLLWKIVFIAAILKAIQAAFAYRNEQRAMAAEEEYA